MAVINLIQEDNDSLDTSVGASCSGRSVTGGTAISRDCVDGGSAGTAEILPALVNVETTVVALQFTSGAIGFTGWQAGDYVIPLDITTTASVLSVEEVYVCRVNSSNVSQETIGSLTGIGRSLGTAQVESFTVSGSATTASATDRIQIIVIFTNTHTHGGDDAVGITMGQSITTPLDPGGVATEISATRDDLILANQNATINAETSFTTNLDALVLADFNTTINAETSFTTSLDPLVLAPFNTTVKIDTAFTTVKDSLILTAYACDVSLGLVIDAAVDNLVLTEQNATIKADTSFTTNLDALVLTNLNSTVNAETSFTASLDSLALTNLNATINAETNVNANADALILTSFNTTVTTGSDTEINAGIDTLSLTAQATTINAETSFTAGLDALTLTSFNTTVATGNDTSINATHQALTLVSFNPAITAPIESSGTTGGSYKKRKRYGRPLKSLDYYEKLAKELIEEEEKEKAKLKKLESKLDDKQITVLLHSDPKLENLKSQKKIISTQLEIVEVKSKIIKAQQTLNRIQRELDKADRLKRILQDDEEFLRHYLMVS